MHLSFRLTLPLIASAGALACTAESERRQLRNVLTGPAQGWTASEFRYQEHDNAHDLSSWELVTDVSYDGQTQWTFTDTLNPRSAASLGAHYTGRVTGPDAWESAFDWDIEATFTSDEPHLMLYLYEENVLHQGRWYVPVTGLTADRLEWSIFSENVDGHRIEAELVLVPT